MDDGRREDRIRAKAFDLWIAEGRPFGRHQQHWDAAKEILAIEDSQKETLRPADDGASPPVEPALAFQSLGDVPSLTDQGDAQPGPSREAERAVNRPPLGPPASRPARR